MNKLILVLNCGSSSIKFSVMHPQTSEVVLSGLAEKLNLADAYITFKHSGLKEQESLATEPNHNGALQTILAKLKKLDLLDRIAAVGHRVVHGGEHFKDSVIVTKEVTDTIRKCFTLAPLHNPANLLGIEAAQAAFPQLKHVAVFDTAFHQSIPEQAYLYAVPTKLYEEHELRRYGAHGISYRFVAAEAASVLGKDVNELAMVIAHLGNGASAAAVVNGKSADTTMGLTPLEGLVMGTRSGDVDPSIFSFLQENLGMDINQVTNMLNKESGLLGLSGISNDCREIEEAALKGHKGAITALDVYTYRLAKHIAALCVAATRLDVLVFTGGIGENSPIIRAKTLAHLRFLGLEVDETANNTIFAGKSGIITSSKKPLAMVINTNEELMIAQDTALLTLS